MKILGTFVMASAVALSSTTAVAEEANWYLGIGAGQTKVGDWVSKSDLADLAGDSVNIATDSFEGTFSASTDDTDTGWKIFAGYQFHPNFAVEMAYMDLGEATAKGSATGDFYDGETFFTGSAAIKAKAEATAWTLDGVARTDLAPWVSVFGKVGVYRAKVEESLTVSLTEGEGLMNDSIKDDTTSTGLHFGLGADFEVTQAIAIRAEWERLSKVDGSDGDSNIDLLSVSAIYAF